MITFTVLTASILIVLARTPFAATLNPPYDGTVERFAHGFLEVRSFSDCKLHHIGLSIDLTPETERLIFKKISAAIAYRHNALVFSEDENGLETLDDLRPSNSKGDADTKCVTDLGTQHVDGYITSWGYGNNGAGFQLRLPNGHSVSFGWVYYYGSPRISRQIGLHCDGLRVTCSAANAHVRVTYRITISGDGAELRPIAVDAL